VQLATIQELARYWVTDCDWRRCEARPNALPQFKTEIGGVDIHFIHVKSAHANGFTDVEQNTKEQIQGGRSHPWISQDVPVRGFIYDVNTGRLSEVVADGETVTG
jgi:carbonic anhydrase